MSDTQIAREIINVTIRLAANAITQAGFGTPLFIGTTDPGASPKVALYGSLEEVAETYDTTDPEYLAAQAFFAQRPQPKQILLGYKSGSETYVEALTAIQAINDDFFFVAIESRLKADAEAMANAVAALSGTRQFHVVTNDADTLDSASTTSTAYALRNANQDQTFLYYHATASLYPEMATIAKVAIPSETGRRGPGSLPVFYQSVSGIAGESFSAAQRAALELNHVNHFRSFVNEVRVFGGQASGGAWFDNMYGLAWLEARLAEGGAQLLTQKADRGEKVGFDDEGLALVDSKLREVLNIAVNTGFILDDFVLTVPTREDTTFTDRANRVLNGIEFEANLVGAVKTMTVSGILEA